MPKSLGKEWALATPIDTILNRTPLTSETNREVIGNRLPNEYLRDLIDKNGESEVLGILESHFISRQGFKILMKDPFTSDDFEDFVKERRAAFLDGIESLLVKERLDMSPQIRALDARIEEIELSLRRTVARHLEDDVN